MSVKPHGCACSHASFADLYGPSIATGDRRIVFAGIVLASGVTATAPASCGADFTVGATTTADGASLGDPHAAHHINIATLARMLFRQHNACRSALIPIAREGRYACRRCEPW